MWDELYERVVDVRTVSDGVMVVVWVFEEHVPRLICRYAPHSEEDWKKDSLFMMS